MDDYLMTTLTKWKTKDFNYLTIVIGNESCDLDSAVCAITYAAFLHWQYNQIKCKVCTKAHRNDDTFKDDLFMPVLNVDRCDYELKTEVAFSLKENGIKEASLVFRDDLNLIQLPSKTNVILVDHHALAKRDHQLVSYITEVIDHRPLDPTAWVYKEDTRSTIEAVGSCCTLVAQRIKDLGAMIAHDVDFFNAFPVLCTLLRDTIILDTVNFSKEVNKATPHDEEIILFLESILKPSDYKAERQHALDRLVAARSDVSSLTPAQLLRKDVKVVADIMVPSFPILVKEFIHRPGALRALNEALALNKCSIVLLLGMDLTGGLRRDMAIYAPEQPERSAQLRSHLVQWQSGALRLEPESLSAAPECAYSAQLNLAASRKQFMPPLQHFIQQNK